MTNLNTNDVKYPAGRIVVVRLFDRYLIGTVVGTHYVGMASVVRVKTEAGTFDKKIAGGVIASFSHITQAEEWMRRYN